MIRDRRTALAVAAVAAWAVLLAAAWLLGQYKDAVTEEKLKLGAMPLYGGWQWNLDERLLLPIAAGAVLIAALPPIAARWRWRWTVAAASLGGIAFSLAMSFAHSHPNTRTDMHRDYGEHIGLIDDAGGLRPFLETYTDVQAAGDFPIHLRSHPPGLVTFLWGADNAGLSGLVFQNAVIMLAAGAAIAAALVVGREVAGERRARLAAPFLVVVPAAYWHNNADIVFGGVALVAVALLVLATGRTGPQAWAFTAAGGLVVGAAAMLTFSSALVALPFLAVALHRRRWDVVLGGGAVAAAVVLAPLAWGYWYLDGMAATRIQYYAGVASVRGYWYFLIGNPAIFALLLGPAVAAALALLRDRATWIVVGSTLAAVAIAGLSGMYSGETERIWQPFVPLALLAGSALIRTRAWLTAQLAVAVVLAAALRSQW